MDEVERLPDDEILDDEHVEAWERRTDEPNLRGVGAYRSDHDEWPWNVDVWVAEFLRDEPLETELTTGVESAIRSVPGVDDVHHEDREVWIVSGIPDGRALVQAVAAFIDGLAPRARPFVEGEE